MASHGFVVGVGLGSGVGRGPGLHAGHSHDADHDEEGGGCLVCELVAVSGGDPGTVGTVTALKAESTGFADFIESEGVFAAGAAELWIVGRGPPPRRAHGRR